MSKEQKLWVHICKPLANPDDDSKYTCQIDDYRKIQHSLYLKSKEIQEFRLDGSSQGIIQMLCSTPFPIALTGGHTVNKIDNDEVIVVGGYSGGKASEKVFHGKMLKNGLDITWR